MQVDEKINEIKEKVEMKASSKLGGVKVYRHPLDACFFTCSIHLVTRFWVRRPVWHENRRPMSQAENSGGSGCCMLRLFHPLTPGIVGCRGGIKTTTKNRRGR